jgi:hypothetical protein
MMMAIFDNQTKHMMSRVGSRPYRFTYLVAGFPYSKHKPVKHRVFGFRFSGQRRSELTTYLAPSISKDADRPAGSLIPSKKSCWFAGCVKLDLLFAHQHASRLI